MLDPASIGLAIAGVKTAAELVKKGIDAAKDVNEVTRDLGKLFDHTETLSQAKKEVGKGKKSKSLSQQAMDIVVAEENAKKQIANIKHKLYWGGYPNGAEIFKKLMKQFAPNMTKSFDEMFGYLASNDTDKLAEFLRRKADGN